MSTPSSGQQWRPDAKRRRFLVALVALLLVESIAWAALYFGWDRKLGFGFRFWSVVTLAAAPVLIAWLAVRTLFVRRGWFTLREFLVFILVIGVGLGWAGRQFQKTRDQRRIAEQLTAHGARVTFGGDEEELGLEQFLGREYFHGVTGVEDYNNYPRSLNTADIEALVRLPELEYLFLQGNAVTYDHLRTVSKLPRLAQLHLVNAHIDRSLLSHLKNHPRLEWLYVGSSRIDDGAFVYLREIPHLNVLLLETTPVSDTDLAHIGALTQLEVLWINHASLTDDGLAQLVGLKQLRSLRALSPNITDAGLEHVAQMEGLTRLVLAGPGITDAGITRLQGLERLKELELNGIRKPTRGGAN